MKRSSKASTRARLGLVILGLVLGLLAIEVVARIGGGLASLSRGRLFTSDHDVILCVGDSHTWGKGKGFPAKLGELLEARSPRYRVVNLGVPGINTAQVRQQWVEYLDLYEPKVVVLWAGLNNAWNRTGSEVWSEAGVAPPTFTERAAQWSRVVRFFRVWAHQEELRKALSSNSAYVKPELEWDRKTKAQTRRFLGQEDAFRPTRRDNLSKEEIIRVTELDVRWLIEQARARGVPVVPIAYGLPGGIFSPTSRGIRQAAEATDAPLVETYIVGDELRAGFAGREDEMPPLFTRSVHPSQWYYDAIAEAVLETMDEQGLLPGVAVR